MAFHEQSFEIKALLFLSGFVILSLEILGIRILAPYVGTTTPVWAALLGVTLAGSAVGYYWGGVLADHVQKKAVFLWLTAGASISITLIPLLRSVLSVVAPYFGYSGGAFIGAMLLFFYSHHVLECDHHICYSHFCKNSRRYWEDSWRFICTCHYRQCCRCLWYKLYSRTVFYHSDYSL